MSNEQAIEPKGDIEFTVGKQVSLILEPGDTPSRYATNLTVQHTDHEFIISFFEARPPLILGTEEERARKMDAIEIIPSQCVARIIVSAGRMQEFVDVLQDNLQKHQNRFLGKG